MTEKVKQKLQRGNEKRKKMRVRNDNCDTRTKFKSNAFNVKKMYSDEKIKGKLFTD